MLFPHVAMALIDRFLKREAQRQLTGDVFGEAGLGEEADGAVLQRHRARAAGPCVVDELAVLELDLTTRTRTRNDVSSVDQS